MYVCLCKGITDRQIRELVQEGALRMRDLRQKLGVCSNCGKCGQCALGVLRETLEALQYPTDGALRPAAAAT